MSKTNLSKLMQISGGTFPTGGFSQSYGLETYVTNGIVKDVATMREFLESYLKVTIGTFEGPALIKAHNLAIEWKEEELLELDELLEAMKLTKESKEASNRMGKSILRISSQMMEDVVLIDFYDKKGKKGISAPVAQGMVSGRMAISVDESLEGYIFATLNGLIQSGIKLIPLGNVEAQKLLFEMMDFIEEVIVLSKETPIEEINNFCPALDIASMNHEVLTTRLYMS